MICDKARESFSEYLEGGTDHDQTASVRDHIGECASCRREFDLFRQTWYALGTLPDVKPPVDLRHEIVMRVARQQHQQTQSIGYSFFNTCRNLVSGNMRGLAIACTVAALAVVLLKVPESTYERFTGMLSPSIRGVESPESRNSSGTIEASPLAQLESENKHKWQTRKVRRNSIWITIESSDNESSTGLYKVLLSINENALFENDYIARIGAKVLLLPSSGFDSRTVESANTVWEGNILSNSPVIVPVIVDRNQAGTVNLLVKWKFRKRAFAQIVFIPTRASGAEDTLSFSINNSGFEPANGDLYSILQGMSRNYGVPIIANALLYEQPSAIGLGEGELGQVLRNTLEPVGLDWLHADKAVYVDRKYDVEVSD